MRRVEGADFVYNNCMIILNCSAGVSVSDEVEAGSLALSGAEAGDGEDGEKQQSMKEGLTGDEKNDIKVTILCVVVYMCFVHGAEN